MLRARSLALTFFDFLLRNFPQIIFHERNFNKPDYKRAINAEYTNDRQTLSLFLCVEIIWNKHQNILLMIFWYIFLINLKYFLWFAGMWEMMWTKGRGGNHHYVIAFHLMYVSIDCNASKSITHFVFFLIKKTFFFRDKALCVCNKSIPTF